MKTEYSIRIDKINGEHVWQLRKGDEIIDSMTWKDGLKHKAAGAYFLKKHNIPYEAAGYSCSE